MTRNVGNVDRVIRLVLGIGLLGLYGALEPPARYFTLFGLVLLGTAITGNCPTYSLLGFNTCRNSSGDRGA